MHTTSHKPAGLRSHGRKARRAQAVSPAAHGRQWGRFGSPFEHLESRLLLSTDIDLDLHAQFVGNNPVPTEYLAQIEVAETGSADAVRLRTPAGRWVSLRPVSGEWYNWGLEHSYADLATFNAEFGDGPGLLEVHSALGGTQTLAFSTYQPGTSIPLPWPTQSPVLISPLQGQTNVPTNATIAWQSLAGAGSEPVDLELHDAADNEVVNVSLPDDQTSYGPVALAAGAWYDLDLDCANRFSVTDASGLTVTVNKEHELSIVLGTSGVPSGPADLVASSVTAASQTLVAGDPIVATVTGGNAGPAAAYVTGGSVDQPVLASFVLSSNQILGDGDDILLGTRPKEGFLPGPLFTATIDWYQVPPSATAGAYYLAVVFDPANTVVESNESNNVAWTSSPSIQIVAINPIVVTIPDANLEAALRVALGKPTGDLTDLDLASLTSLDASNRGVADLSGLEYCTNLTNLSLNDNQISDLSPLAGLTNLWSLDLDRNQITDISPLAGLTNLSSLYLGDNHVADLSPVESLTNLWSMTAPVSQDWGHLSALTNLHWVSFTGVPMASLTPLAGLTSLEYLYLTEIGTSDLSPLAGLTALQVLHLDQNLITDLGPLAGLTNLTELELTGNRIVSLTPLTDLTALASLYLDDNQITDLTPLSGLPALHTLYAWDNQITSLAPLVANPGLGSGDYVGIGGNPLSATALTVEIPALQARGVQVDVEADPRLDIDELSFDRQLIYYDGQPIGSPVFGYQPWQAGLWFDGEGIHSATLTTPNGQVLTPQRDGDNDWSCKQWFATVADMLAVFPNGSYILTINGGQDSVTFSYTGGQDPGGIAQIIYPAAGQTGVPTNAPQFTWTSCVGLGDHLEASILTTVNPDPAVYSFDEAPIGTTTWTLPGSLDATHQYVFVVGVIRERDQVGTSTGGDAFDYADWNAYYNHVLFTTAAIGNHTPTDITLSKTTVAEHQPPGTRVGVLSTTDQDTGDVFTYSLVAGVGDSDNASFAIVGDELQTATTFDLATKSSYSVRLRTTDTAGAWTEKVFTIGITAVGPATQLAFHSQPTGGKAGEPLASFTVWIEDADGYLVTNQYQMSSVQLSVASGPGALYGFLSEVGWVSSGQATFSSTILTEPGTYALTASLGTLTPATSASFLLTPATPNGLGFAEAPSYVLADSTRLGAVQVAVQTAFGVPVSTDTSLVTLAIASGPAGAVLGGTTTVAAVNGIATFSDLSLTVPGTYTFIATDGSLTPVTSSPVPIVFRNARYSWSELWTLDEGFQYDMNQLGQIVGSDTTLGNVTHAFLYDAGTITDLGTLGGTSSYATGINDLGQITGYAATPGDTATHAFLYAGGTMTDLGTLGGTSSYATGINDLGQIVGWSFTASGSKHAFLYAGGTMIDLGTLGGTDSYAEGINNLGQIVGYAATPGDTANHAFLYAGGTMTDLGTLGGNDSRAYGINDVGQIVGTHDTPSLTYAFLYSGGTMVSLGALPGDDGSTPMAINASGRITGQSNRSDSAWNFYFPHHGFLYEAGTLIDLNAIVAGNPAFLRSARAVALNDAGQILVVDSDHGYLLSPINAPNQAPTVMPLSKGVDMNTPLTFTAATFAGAFSDPDAGDTLQKVQITTLPAHGTLRLNGVAVTLDQEIPVGQLGTLTYTPASGYAGSDAFGWNGSDGVAYATTAATVSLLVSPANIVWSTYFGGSGDEEIAPGGLVIDAGGNEWIGGWTESADLPHATNAYHTGASNDAYVARLDANGTVLWSTYIGGTDYTTGLGIAVDALGNTFIVGDTGATNLDGALNSPHGNTEAFLARISPSGTLLWSLYLGGSGEDRAKAVAVDASGNAYLTGYTLSSDLAGASGTYGGGKDVFVAKVNAAGVLQWARYLGGSGEDRPGDMAVNAAGESLIAGVTASAGLANATNAYLGGSADAFVAKLNASGSVQWLTYLGGSGDDAGALGDLAGGLAWDADGTAVVTGYTASPDLGLAQNAYQGGGDGFVCKIDAGGGLVWSRYLGGAAMDAGVHVALDGLHNAWVVGAADITLGGSGMDDLIAKLGPSGTLAWLTQTGGSSNDLATSVVLDAAGNAWISGGTWSSDLPAANNTSHGGQPGDTDEPHEGFLARLWTVADTFTVSGDAAGAGQNDQFRLVRNPSNAKLVDVFGSAGSTPTWQVYLPTLQDLTFAGLGGDDTLVIDFGHGNPLPAAGLTFAGGAGTNTLTLIGASAADAFALTTGQVGYGTTTLTYSHVTNLDLQTGTFMATQDLGSLAVALTGSTSLILTSDQLLASLSVGAGSSVTMSGTGKLLGFGDLTVSSTGLIDLGGNDLLLQVPAGGDVAAAYAGLRNLVHMGFGSNPWTGTTGITSSAAAASGLMRGLAAVQNADLIALGLGLGAFHGQATDGNSIAVCYRAMGDANLDGTVDTQDYALINAGFAAAHPSDGGVPANPPSGWLHGDFTYDDWIDGRDYFFIDHTSHSLVPVTAPTSAPAAPDPAPAATATSTLEPAADPGQVAPVAVPQSLPVPSPATTGQTVLEPTGIPEPVAEKTAAAAPHAAPVAVPTPGSVPARPLPRRPVPRNPTTPSLQSSRAAVFSSAAVAAPPAPGAGPGLVPSTAAAASGAGPVAQPVSPAKPSAAWPFVGVEPTGLPVPSLRDYLLHLVRLHRR